MEPDGSAKRVGAALALINQALREAMAERESDFDAETRWAAAWFDSFGNNDGLLDEAEILAKTKNTTLHALTEASLVKLAPGISSAP